MRKLLLATALFALPALALANGSNGSSGSGSSGSSSTGTPFSITSSTTDTIGSGSQSISSGEATAPLGTTAFAISGNAGIGTTTISSSPDGLNAGSVSTSFNVGGGLASGGLINENGNSYGQAIATFDTNLTLSGENGFTSFSN
jgi:hypothetical protein